MKFPRVRFSISAMLVMIAFVAVGLVLWERYVAWPWAQAEFRVICISPATPYSEAKLDAIVQSYPQLAKDTRAMAWAAENGNVELCRRLLSLGSPLNDPKYDGELTPLYYAIDKGQAEVVQFLLAEGVDPIAGESLGGISRETPLYFAAARGHVEICRIFIAAGADVNEELDNGSRPLFASVLSGNPQAVKFLLDQGARFSPEQNVPPRDWIEMVQAHASHVPITKQNAEKIIQLLEQRLPELSMEARQGMSP